jgi:hypothetical protein
MCVRHFCPLYLSGLGLTCPDLVLQHVHALVTHADKILGLHESALAHGEHERRVSKVGRAAMGVAVEVVDEFLDQHRHELRVKAGLRGEVGVVRQRSSDRARQVPWEQDPLPRDLE